MADKGFIVEKLVQEKGASLNIPAFLHERGLLEIKFLKVKKLPH